MSTVFITGGAGFIGSHVSERFLSEGKTVTVYDNLVSGRKEWIEHLLGKKGFTFIQADLLDFETLKKTMQRHEIVWHLGANTDIRAGHRILDLDLRNCTVGTYNVLEAMRQNRIDKLLFASSATVYGEAPIEPLPENYGPLLPISLYGAGKLACEGLISAYSSLFSIKAWIFRFANVIGGRMRRAVIYDFIEKLKRNPKELEILGDGHQEKPFFLVDDCIDGMLCAFQNAKTSCDIFNLGCDSTTNVTRIAEIVVEEMGLKDVKFKYTGGRRGWVGDVPQVKFNVEKMKRFGWQTKYTSDEAVRIATRRILGKEKYESVKIH
jgi:UDP-glucose 4-epimerase